MVSFKNNFALSNSFPRSKCLENTCELEASSSCYLNSAYGEKKDQSKNEISHNAVLLRKTSLLPSQSLYSAQPGCYSKVDDLRIGRLLCQLTF
jgi:hypothetical protein